MQPCDFRNSFCSYLPFIYPIQSNKITIQTKWYLECTNVKKWFCLVNRWHLYQGKIIYRLWNGLVLFFPFQSRCSPDAHFLRICILKKFFSWSSDYIFADAGIDSLRFYTRYFVCQNTFNHIQLKPITANN